MLLLASDYDKTLKTTEYDLRLNIKFLKKFIDNGNIFLLNTGRPYESIKREIDKYDIPFNFLGCNDGNIMFDNSSNILYTADMNNNLYNELNYICDKFKILVKPIIFNDKILEFELITLHIDKIFWLELHKFMIKYKLCFKVFKESDGYHIYIYSNLINKKTPIEYLKKSFDISYSDIYTIGDHYNDLEMIRDYNGYSMKWAKKEVKAVSIDTCLTVASLIKKIDKGR